MQPIRITEPAAYSHIIGEFICQTTIAVMNSA